jgi:SAM-dependent MidA family methyltransferase
VLIALIRDEIDATGRITFARFMDLALYHPEFGYYMSPIRRPGRSGDFLTAPEMHPFFGLTIARQIVECWDRLGNPGPFTVLEYGSGIGGLAYDVIAGMFDARPEMRSALRYRLNDINPHRTVQALAAMAEVGLADVVEVDSPDDVDPFTGVVLANEVADAMPVHRLRWTGTGFEELWVTWDDPTGFVERAGALSPEVAAFDPVAYLTRAGLDLESLPVDARIEISPATAAWVRDIARRLARGYALIVDYGYPAAELYADHRLASTLRMYSNHQVTDKPYDAVGERDMTAHVDFSLIIDVARQHGMMSAGLTTQADFLAGTGLGELLVNLQQEPGIAIEDYYRAQAAVFRLIDPAGMGRFRVLGLARNAPVSPPLRGFAGPDLPENLRLA